MRKTLVALAAAALLLTGCSNGSDQPSGSSTSPVTVSIKITGDKVTPNGDRINVKVGQTVTLKIDSDRAGELHVHSTPEQHIEYTKGASTEKVSIDKPGIVDIEDHDASVVVVQLEVS